MNAAFSLGVWAHTGFGSKVSLQLKAIVNQTRVFSASVWFAGFGYYFNKMNETDTGRWLVKQLGLLYYILPLTVAGFFGSLPLYLTHRLIVWIYGPVSALFSYNAIWNYVNAYDRKILVNNLVKFDKDYQKVMLSIIENIKKADEKKPIQMF